MTRKLLLQTSQDDSGNYTVSPFYTIHDDPEFHDLRLFFDDLAERNRIRSRTPDPRAKKVVVVDIEEDKHLSYCAKSDISEGLPSRRCTIGQVFASSMEASAHLGCRNNQVANLYAKIRQAFPEDYSQRIVSIRGVKLMYEIDHLMTSEYDSTPRRVCDCCKKKFESLKVYFARPDHSGWDEEGRGACEVCALRHGYSQAEEQAKIDAASAARRKAAGEPEPAVSQKPGIRRITGGYSVTPLPSE